MTARKDAAALAERGLTYLAPGPVAATCWAQGPDGNVVVRVDGKETPAMTKAQQRGEQIAAAMRQGAAPYFQDNAYARGLRHVVQMDRETRSHDTWRDQQPVKVTSESHTGQQEIPFDYREATSVVRIWHETAREPIAPVKRRRRSA